MKNEFKLSDLEGFTVGNQHKIIQLYGDKLSSKKRNETHSIELYSFDDKLILCEFQEGLCIKILPVSSEDVIELFGK